MARNSALIVTLVLIVQFILGFGAGVTSRGTALDREETSLFAKLMACGYTRHGISDMAWIYYVKGIIPAGSARYFTVRLHAENTGAVAVCIKEKIG